jgi:hypothetical protein
MRWHAESPLVESRKGLHVSFHKRGERRVRRHLIGLELHHRHKPMLHEFLHVAQCNRGRNPVLLHNGSRRKEGHHLQVLGIASYFPFLFLSRHREGGKKRMIDGAQGYRGAQGQPLTSNSVVSVVKRLGPPRCSKGPGKLSLPTSPTPHRSS